MYAEGGMLAQVAHARLVRLHRRMSRRLPATKRAATVAAAAAALTLLSLSLPTSFLLSSSSSQPVAALAGALPSDGHYSSAPAAARLAEPHGSSSSLSIAMPTSSLSSAAYRRRERRMSASVSRLVNNFRVPVEVARLFPEQDAMRLLQKLDLVEATGKPATLMIAHVQNGLGNRLRALASALAIARGTARVPVVVWEKDAHLGAAFEDILVAKHPSLNDTASILYKDLVVLRTFPAWSAMRHRSRYWRAFNYMGKDGDGALRETLFFESTNLRCRSIFANILSLLRGRTCARSPDTISPRAHVYLKSAYVAEVHPWTLTARIRVNREMRRLTPVAEVMRIVYANYPTSARVVYGIHIRSRLVSADGVGVSAQCEYTASAEEMTDFWRSKSQLPVFINIMRRLARMSSAIHFFVAVDDSRLLAHIENKFPGHVHYIRRTCDDRRPECVRYAFADMICLARSRRIYGSNWSSFTEAAARLSGRKPRLSGIHFGHVRMPQIHRNVVIRHLRTLGVFIARAWRIAAGRTPRCI